MSNKNLHKAKAAKNDEFYTKLDDVSNELCHYDKHFKNKIVFCNCDDPTTSAFWKYFHLKFQLLGLKKLISTHYERDKFSYKLEYEGGNDNDIDVGTQSFLSGNGDFRSEECVELLKEADVVVTNPPFSLAREYIAMLMKYEKKFLIVGDLNWVTYKETFPLIKEDKIWLGYCNIKEFVQPDGTKKKFGNKLWFTNLDIKKRHEKMILWEAFDAAKFPQYDNYNAIEVEKTSLIPKDYLGVMGVPISFLQVYNPSQFEIIGMGCGWNGASPLVITKYDTHQIQHTYDRKKNSFSTSIVGKMNDGTPLIKLMTPPTNETYYEVNSQIYHRTYGRVLIKRKQ